MAFFGKTEGNYPHCVAFDEGLYRKNNVFLRLLRGHFPDAERVVSPAPMGSSPGAARTVNRPGLARPFIPDVKSVGTYA